MLLINLGQTLHPLVLIGVTVQELTPSQEMFNLAAIMMLLPTIPY